MQNFDSFQKSFLEPFILAVFDTSGKPVFESSLFQKLSGGRFFYQFPDKNLAVASPEIISGIAMKSIQLKKSCENFELFDSDNQKWYSCKSFVAADNSAALSFFEVTERRRREDSLRYNEDALLRVQNVVHVGVWEWDIVRNHMIWSEEIYKVYGQNPEIFKVSFDNHIERIHPDDRDHFKKVVFNGIDTKTQFYVDKRIIRPDGSIRYLHTFGQPVMDNHGEVVKIVGVCQDVTDFKLSEISLEQTLSLLRATIESTADGLLVVDPDGKIVTFNRKFADLWKIPDSILNLRDDTKALDYVVGQLKSPEKFISKVQELYSQPLAESFDTLEFKDGRIVERYSKPQIIKDEPVGRVWSFRDVSVRVHAERDAQAASIAKAQFLANISHEIRTPLTAVLGFSDLLADVNLSAKDRIDLVSRIKIQGDNLLHIVDDILDLSKIEFGHFRIKEAQVNILELVQELTQIFSFRLIDKKTKLEFKTEGTVPSKIFSDPIRLKQILINLIGNAIKFTWEGTVEVLLTFIPATESAGAQLSFKIRDTGIGMDMSQSQKLFEPFMQIDSSLTRRFSGTGLGLALSRDLAMALGGTVRLLDSAIGIGSTFEARINTGDVTRAFFVSNLNTETEKKETPAPADVNILKGLRILLVEDSVDNQFIVSQYLKRAGAEIVDCASNGKQGIDYAMAGEYDIVFMDLQMPILNGYETTEQLRKLGFKKPIIALTAHAMQEEIQRCRDAGCDYHLSKPIDRNKIISAAYDFTKGHTITNS